MGGQGQGFGLGPLLDAPPPPWSRPEAAPSEAVDEVPRLGADFGPARLGRYLFLSLPLGFFTRRMTEMPRLLALVCPRRCDRPALRGGRRLPATGPDILLPERLVPGGRQGVGVVPEGLQAGCRGRSDHLRPCRILCECVVGGGWEWRRASVGIGGGFR